MFNLRNFIKRGILDSIGYEPIYKITNNAMGWYDKGILTEDDLSEIDAKIALHYNPVEPVKS